MTTAAPTAAPTPPRPTTAVENVRIAERDRLRDAVKAAADRLEQLQKVDLITAQTQLTGAAADVAALDQQASRLQQQLTAATTGPERHRIELELDATAVGRFRALRRRVDAATSRAGLEATVTQVAAGVAALAPRLQQATERLDVLLGSAGMRTELAARLGAVAAQDATRGAALAAAEEAVRAAEAARAPVEGALTVAIARHDRALTAVRDAQAAPLRLAAAAAAVEVVIALPGLADEELAAIRAAATGTDDPAVIPVVPPATDLENWAIKIPATVLAPALALVDAQAVLALLATLDAAALLAELAAAEADYVAALVAQLAAAQAQATVAATAAAARDDVAAHEATAADRRALAVSGD